MNWRNRTVVAVAATTLLGLGGMPAAQAADDGGTKADQTQLLLVHGYGDSASGTDCNGSVWKKALDYYQGDGGRDRSSMTTVGYYEGDEKADKHGAGCDAVVGDGKATNERPIQDIAKDFANYIHDNYTAKDKPVNIVGHSMGGLVTRVALLGSAQGWEGFPGKLDVDNVVTLSTPHQGVADASKHNDRQWNQMDYPNSGFMRRLHQKDSQLSGDWAKGTDWSLVGSHEDTTVSYNSGIDEGHHADQKFGYQKDGSDGGTVSHSGVRALSGGDYNLRYWHASGEHHQHDTKSGWSPLKAAFKAATHVGDDLPK